MRITLLCPLEKFNIIVNITAEQSIIDGQYTLATVKSQRSLWVKVKFLISL